MAHNNTASTRVFTELYLLSQYENIQFQDIKNKLLLTEYFCVETNYTDYYETRMGHTNGGKHGSVYYWVCGAPLLLHKVFHPHLICDRVNNSIKRRIN